jgi:ABC-type antimicrobial peptide transport system permease subunit
MRIYTFLARNLTWYWRTNLAVLLGVATGVGVLGGALLVGQSVRSSLRDLVLGRLGNADFVISRNGFFREDLASSFNPACPVIAMNGVVVHEPSGRRASRVQIYGVDERFWKFQNEPGNPPRDRQILLSAALEQELGGRSGDAILIRVEKPSAIPLESLHGRKEDVGKTIRLIMADAPFREFSLGLEQGDVRAVLVPLARLERDLAQRGKVNTVLVGDQPAGLIAVERTLKDSFALRDLGLRLRTLEKQRCLSLESDSALISDPMADTASSTAKSLGLRTDPVLTYLANSIRVGKRGVPYSVVTALDSPPAPSEADGITLNQWAASELHATPGDQVTLDYYLWKSDGRLHTERAQFRLVRVVPIEGEAADRDFAPDYPGITQSESLYDWDPPFPLDLSRVRPVDEQYWKQYRTTPKAFVPLVRGQHLWGTRFGRLTSVRVFSPGDSTVSGQGAYERYGNSLRAALDPAKMGLTVFAVKAHGLEAAQGSTDFGQYFIYFSFFLMTSAVLLTALFFGLGVEQRMREIGVLRALGFSMSNLRVMFLLEGAVLAMAGGILGIVAALSYGELIIFGLRTWWTGAVGTTLLSLRASISSLAIGAAGGVVAGLASTAWTLRRLQPVTPRGLLAGSEERGRGRHFLFIGLAAGALALALLAAAITRALDQTVGFFGAGTLLLVAALCFVSTWLNSRSVAEVNSQVTLGLRSATSHPGRSVLCIALIASATFVIISLDAFRRGDTSAGTGGFPLIAESALPLIHDPNTSTGRDALNIPALKGVEFVPFRLRPGDDASCLNLYRPHNPRILAPPPAFLRRARFNFQDSVLKTPNPWTLLESQPADGAVPAIADANSMTYTLHLKLGQEFVLGQQRFRIVAALKDSIFQSELLISEKNFLRLFPDVEGYRLFLVNAPPARAQEVAGALEGALADYGFDIQPAGARLAGFHKVENTYLSTFRSLGALGLILGTVGLGAILLRNVLERRRELALLRAVGYRPRHLAEIVLAENMLMLLLGLTTGTACALLATMPAVSLRGGGLPVPTLALLLGIVLITGVGASLAATAAALRSPLLTALRAE